VARYFFCSHDGFGLGHVRRNTLIAEALLSVEPQADIAILTGVATQPSWLQNDRFTVYNVPPLLKGADGSYRGNDLSFEQALTLRAEVFHRAVTTWRPDVIVVDRHPYGTGGELRAGLTVAKQHGAAVVLGLRDVLDEPRAIRTELTGPGWADVPQIFDDVLVYGERHLCDHEAEYGLPMHPTYCGWVAGKAHQSEIDEQLVVVTAGGGGDGADVYRLGADMLRHLPGRRAVFVAGPYASNPAAASWASDAALWRRIEVVANAPGCTALFARAGAVVQMAGYNSTVEALAAGHRPVLVPRRSPRREQAIRASRLASLGLADVVDEGAAGDEAAWLVARSRRLPKGALAAAGLRFDGASTAAERLRALVSVAA
jgi:predicted glycosyltransferase